MANSVVIVGGGASGLAAAVFAAGNGADVTVLEHKDRVGKKLLMTGNGKCNLTNMGDVHGKYYSSDGPSLDKIYDALARFDAGKTRSFFRGLGLFTKEKRDGCVYPCSEQASTVLDVLRSECARQNVRLVTDCEAKEVIPDGRGGTLRFVKNNRKGIIRYDRLILATGGKAASVAGSDGSGYTLAKQLGHSVIPPLPALVQLKCQGDFFKAVAGVRAQCRAGLFVEGSFSAAEEGELQLTNYGISGIPVFQFSRIAARALYDGKKCEVRINFIPLLSPAWLEDENSVVFESIRALPHKAVEEFLSGLVHKKLAALICKKNKVSAGETVAQAGFGKMRRCVENLADFRVRVIGTNSFENAQVCCGGVPLLEVDRCFQSDKHRHVYFVGELLDCDGICGGYNLQWAWATGAIAGEEAAK